MKGRKSLLWADNIKAFLILLVVIGHTIQYSVINYTSSHVFNYIYSFHMPLFMLISGFLSYKESSSVSWDGVKRRGIQLLIPYVIWTLVFCLTMRVPIKERLFETPVYWFLLLLFLICVLMTLCQKVATWLSLKSEIVCIVVLFVLFIFYAVFKPQILSLNILHLHFLFFSIGWYLRKYENRFLRNWLIVPTGVLFFFMGWFYVHGSPSPLVPFLPSGLYYIITGTIGSLFFLTLFRQIFDKPCRGGFVGRLTLGIYVIHLWICCILSPLFHDYVQQNGLKAIFVIVAGIMAVSIILSLLFAKSKTLYFIIGLRRETSYMSLGK